ncbi:hypothetical protein GCM10010466_67850 [Planomonospora alba]|uniref:Resolvase/invertase-type recombinase catalytic domain-containing protein n=1 Tax=Planomonospora alba TaxID=161354 RepID=A0ABP6P774_9ACTN
MVPSLDRYGRSLADLIAMVGELHRREIGFTSLHENLDTPTPGGRLVFHVFAALAEFIRELIVAGTREGLAAAKARGRIGGRPTVVTPEILRAARDPLPNPEHSIRHGAGSRRVRSAALEPRGARGPALNRVEPLGGWGRVREKTPFTVSFCALRKICGNQRARRGDCTGSPWLRRGGGAPG